MTLIEKTALLESFAQKSHPLCSIICSYYSEHANKFSALLEIIYTLACMLYTDGFIRMYHDVIVLLE